MPGTGGPLPTALPREVTTPGAGRPQRLPEAAQRLDQARAAERAVEASRRSWWPGTPTTCAPPLACPIPALAGLLVTAPDRSCHASLQSFHANWLWWHASALAYNAARWIRTLALPAGKTSHGP